jgi:two-component system chemotaxis response regulator CheB
VRPDVALLDVEMPRLDGLSTLDRIVADFGLPVVMCSTRTRAGAEAALEALRRGAVDFIEKPTSKALASGQATVEIVSRLRNAVNARVRVAQSSSTSAPPPRTGQRQRSPHEAIRQLALKATPELIAIGTSTGGPPALEQILTQLPAGFPLSIVIVQHMPPGFTEMLAQHLNRVCQITVREATDCARRQTSAGDENARGIRHCAR